MNSFNTRVIEDGKIKNIVLIMKERADIFKIPKEFLLDNVNVKSWLEPMTQDRVVSLVHKFYESEETKTKTTTKKPKVTEIKDWELITHHYPNTWFEYVKLGIYILLGKYEFLDWFRTKLEYRYPVKYKKVVVDEIPVLTQHIEQTIINHNTTIKTVYPDIKVDTEYKTLTKYDKEF